MNEKKTRRVINVALAAAFMVIMYLLSWQPFGEFTSTQITINTACVVVVIPLIAWALAENNKEFLGR